MANEEVVVGQPDVGFDAGTAGGEGVVKGNFSGVVVVGVAGDWCDIATEVSGKLGLCLGG